MNTGSSYVDLTFGSGTRLSVQPREYVAYIGLPSLSFPIDVILCSSLGFSRDRAKIPLM